MYNFKIPPLKQQDRLNTYNINKLYKPTVQHNLNKSLNKSLNKQFILNFFRRLFNIRKQQQQRPPLKLNTYIPKEHKCFSDDRKKIALLIGINYNGDEKLKLNGCINDTKTIKTLLLNHYGYSDNDIIVLTDDTETTPTRENIENILENIVNKIRNKGITEFFISYSGHGTYQYDWSGDEDDGKDEAIVPLDCNKNGIITDDELHKKYLSKLPNNVNVFALMDCCHSGTILDLEYKYNHRGGTPRNGVFVRQQNKKLNCKVIKISGCRDDQYSMDAFIDGKYCGAMTASFEKTMIKSMDCRDLLARMTTYLKNNNFEQRPVLTSSFNYNKYDKLLLN